MRFNATDTHTGEGYVCILEEVRLLQCEFEIASCIWERKFGTSLSLVHRGRCKGNMEMIDSATSAPLTTMVKGYNHYRKLSPNTDSANNDEL